MEEQHILHGDAELMNNLSALCATPGVKLGDASKPEPAQVAAEHHSVDAFGNAYHWYRLVEPGALVPAAHLLKDKGARLCMISPYNVRHMGEMQPEVCYHFELGGVVYNLTAVLDPKRPAVPSITPVFDNADWHEREMMELFKISVEQHPNPRRLFLDEKLDAGILNQAVPLSVMMNGACTTDLWERILAGKGDTA